jgi:type IX secretion system PorP/SprF family membrane protein
MTVGIHFPFPNKALAAGILIQNEKIGISSNTSYYGNYAYRIRTKKGFLSFGLKAGFESSKENVYKISTEDNGDAVFEPGSEGYILPNFGVGVYYYDTKFFLGASLPVILSYREREGGFEVYNNTRNYNVLFLSGMLININDFISIKPSTLIRYHCNSKTQLDLNCNLILFKDGFLWLGAAYRSSEALVGMMEFQLNPQLKIGYSYDYFNIGTLHNGSHELMLRYEFRYIVKAINPKYF